MSNRPRPDLKLCPFCGGEPVEYTHTGYDSETEVTVACPECGIGYDEPDTEEKWNTRTAAPGMAWVATSEGLPEGAWPVLVAGNFYSVRQLVAWYCREMNGEPAHWESRGESWPVEQVTHWMELPPAPETGEGR